MCNSVGKIIGSGTPATAATNISGDVAAALTATGSSQATAFPIAANYNQFTLVPTSTGCVMPASSAPGDQFFIASEGSATLSIYPELGSSINAISANGAYSLATAKTAILTKLTPTKWYTLFTA